MHVYSRLSFQLALPKGNARDHPGSLYRLIQFPQRLMDLLAGRPPRVLIAAVLGCSSLPDEPIPADPEHLTRLSWTKALARNPSTPTWAMTILSRGCLETRLVLAGNPALPRQLMYRLAEQESERLRLRLALNPRLDSGVIDRLLRVGNLVKLTLVRHPKLQNGHIRFLATAQDEAIQQAVLRRAKLSFPRDRELFDILAQSCSPRVVRAAYARLTLLADEPDGRHRADARETVTSESRQRGGFALENCRKILGMMTWLECRCHSVASIHRCPRGEFAIYLKDRHGFAEALLEALRRSAMLQTGDGQSFPLFSVLPRPGDEPVRGVCLLLERLTSPLYRQSPAKLLRRQVADLWHKSLRRDPLWMPFEVIPHPEDRM